MSDVWSSRFFYLVLLFSHCCVGLRLLSVKALNISLKQVCVDRSLCYSVDGRGGRCSLRKAGFWVYILATVIWMQGKRREDMGRHIKSRVKWKNQDQGRTRARTHRNWNISEALPTDKNQGLGTVDPEKEATYGERLLVVDWAQI